MPGNGQQQLTRWTFTINNWTEEEKELVDNLVESGQATYVCYGLEVGEGGTPHIQGYLELRNKRRLNGVRQLIGGRGHLDGSRGSAKDNRVYCAKGKQPKEEFTALGELGPNYGLDADFHEFGTPKEQGKRSDLSVVKESIDAGASVDDLWKSHFGAMVRYEKSFKRYKARNCRRDSSRAPEIFVLWGRTGTGKSGFPRLTDPDLFSVPDVKLKWWDGYEGDQVILFDDFDGVDVAIADFLRYTDRYAVQVPIKGGFEPLMATRIWIAANTQPEDWFPNELQVKRDAVRRRLTRVVHLDAPINFEDENDIQHIKTLLNLQ